MKPPRNIKAAPWCWAEKTALRRIREGCDDITYLDQVLAVYLTMIELASDEQQGDTFTASKRKVAERSGVSPRRVFDIQDKLAALGLLTWKQNPIEGTSSQGPCTYTLLGSLPHARDAGGTAGGAGPTAKNGNGIFAENISKESPEESPEESPRKKVATTQTAKPVWSPLCGWENISSDQMQEWKEAYPACDIPRQLRQMTVWLKANPAKAKKSNWLAFAAKWLARSQDSGGDLRGRGNEEQAQRSIGDKFAGWEGK